MLALLLLMALECPVTVTGSVKIYLKAYYMHENPHGQRYVYTTPTQIATNATVTITDVEGYPVAFEWYARPYGTVTKAELEFELAATCGEVPDPVFPFIFGDGFESGDTRMWSEVFNPPPPPPEVIFEDGFESGDLEAWG